MPVPGQSPLLRPVDSWALARRLGPRRRRPQPALGVRRRRYLAQIIRKVLPWTLNISRLPERKNPVEPGLSIIPMFLESVVVYRKYP